MTEMEISRRVETPLETSSGTRAQEKADPEADQPEERRHSAFRENAVSIIVCAIFAFFVTTYVVHPMTVPTSSMEPTILVGDRVLVDKFTVRNAFSSGLPLAARHEVRRGDIVVFKHPTETESLWVKRVIGLPDETVEIQSKQVYIDGRALEEPYKYHSDPSVFPGGNRDNFGPVRVPEDAFFVMGDNRDNSLDSRYWGFLRRDLLVGRPLITFWSYEDRPNAHQITGFKERLELYAERVIYFIPRTRWSRMGRIVE